MIYFVLLTLAVTGELSLPIILVNLSVYSKAKPKVIQTWPDVILGRHPWF